MRHQSFFGLIFAVLMIFPGSALAEGKQNFTLINKTGYTIEQVYVSPSKSDDWEEDVLGRDVLVNKDFVDIEFSRKVKTCKWDVKVIYDDKEEAEWHGFDLCSVSRISISYDRKTGDTWATYD